MQISTSRLKIPIMGSLKKVVSQRTDLWLPRGQGEGWSESLGLADANYDICGMDKQGPTVQHRELYPIAYD